MKLFFFEIFESQQSDYENWTLADIQKVPTIISSHIYIQKNIILVANNDNLFCESKGTKMVDVPGILGEGQ